MHKRGRSNSPIPLEHRRLCNGTGRSAVPTAWISARDTAVERASHPVLVCQVHVFPNDGDPAKLPHHRKRVSRSPHESREGPLLGVWLTTSHQTLYRPYGGESILKNGDAATGRIARWQHQFGEFKYKVMHVPGKEVAIADGLSRLGKFQYTVGECKVPTVVPCVLEEEATDDAPDEWQSWLNETWYHDVVYFKLHGEAPPKNTGQYCRAATK